jgi:DNA helicase-2/ATP-dependent DNA helicase PcrA
LLERTGYLRALEAENTIEAEARLENLKELLSAVEEFERQNLELRETGDEQRDLVDLFLEQVTLLSEADTVDTATDRVPLMTVHVAKGLEFKHVFVVGLEEGIFPHYASLEDPAAIEEERRLCYVAMTRAMQRLTLCNATLRRLHGAARYNPPSRFLAEIPDELITGRRMRGRTPLARPAQAPAPAAPRESGPRIDYSESQLSHDEAPPLTRDQRVEHPIFGAGRIMEVVGEGPAAKATIRFDRAGVKVIKVKYAQLRLCD